MILAWFNRELLGAQVHGLPAQGHGLPKDNWWIGSNRGGICSEFLNYFFSVWAPDVFWFSFKYLKIYKTAGLSSHMLMPEIN